MRQRLSLNCADPLGGSRASHRCGKIYRAARRIRVLCLQCGPALSPVHTDVNQALKARDNLYLATHQMQLIPSRSSEATFYHRCKPYKTESENALSEIGDVIRVKRNLIYGWGFRATMKHALITRFAQVVTGSCVCLWEGRLSRGVRESKALKQLSKSYTHG